MPRLLVPRDRLAEAEEAAAGALQRWRIGDPHDDTTTVGPLISAAARDRVTDTITRAIEDGARIVAEGPGDLPSYGYFVSPAILSDVDRQSPVAREETFGPVLLVMPYDDELDAIALANATRYGLSGAVWSSEDQRATDVARQLRTGQIAINGGAFDPTAPFGGRNDSGYGRECGSSGLHEFVVTKAMLGAR